MTKRLLKIYELIPSCNTFADIGCDHGYIAKAMLDSKKCKSVVIADISEKCLSKAKALLSAHILDGSATYAVSDGFKNVPLTDVALIAGMGGEETVKILTEANALPEKLVLQPMKNCNKVRECVVNLGYRIVYDSVFKAGKIFYDLILAEKGKDFLTEEEIEFGRDNIKGNNADFKQKLQLEYEMLTSILKKGLNVTDEVGIKSRILRIEKYV